MPQSMKEKKLIPEYKTRVYYYRDEQGREWSLTLLDQPSPPFGVVNGKRSLPFGEGVNKPTSDHLTFLFAIQKETFADALYREKKLRESTEIALRDTQSFIGHLVEEYKILPDDLKYFLYTPLGFFVQIPWPLYRDEVPGNYLSAIYEEMAFGLLPKYAKLKTLGKNLYGRVDVVFGEGPLNHIGLKTPFEESSSSGLMLLMPLRHKTLMDLTGDEVFDLLKEDAELLSDHPDGPDLASLNKNPRLSRLYTKACLELIKTNLLTPVGASLSRDMKNPGNKLFALQNAIQNCSVLRSFFKGEYKPVDRNSIHEDFLYGGFNLQVQHPQS